MALDRRKKTMCSSTRRVTTQLLLSWLALSTPAACQVSQAPVIIPPRLPEAVPAIQPNSHDFTLRHIFHHGTYQDPNLHKRADIFPDTPLSVSSLSDTPVPATSLHYEAASRGMKIERLSDRQHSSIEEHLAQARLTGQAVSFDVSDWTLDEVAGPDVTDKDTVINLATMAANAYDMEPGANEWEDVSGGFNYSQSFGWEGDGLRGHIFADKDNRTIILSLKGTSPAVFDGDGTTTKDKLNDNLFFSCCCAQGGQYFWRQVCDCYSSTYTCNNTCLVKQLKRENRYYRAALDLYSNVTEIYPDSDVWLVGHSLGGAVASLLGMTYGLPVVAFEAPGDALAAHRLGLPTPPNYDPSRPQDRRYTGTYHIGHTADPVFMGSCNGPTATCTLGGYAMESQCHTGLQCVYDTVEDFGWRVGIGNHKIHIVIDTVIKKYDKVPTCVPDDECRDCFNWKYFESNGSDTSTSSRSSSTSTRTTRTTTCKTPGWWGCLDETTTKSPTTTSYSTSTLTTTSCKTPGWFGCKDPITTTITTTIASPSLSATSASASLTQPESTSCGHPGWFGGCNDLAETSHPKSHDQKSHSTTTQSSSTCETPGLFFGCRDKYPKDAVTSPPITGAPTLTSFPTTATATKQPEKHKGKKCKQALFLGMICLDPARETKERLQGPSGIETRTNSEL